MAPDKAEGVREPFDMADYSALGTAGIGDDACVLHFWSQFVYICRDLPYRSADENDVRTIDGFVRGNEPFPYSPCSAPVGRGTVMIHRGDVRIPSFSCIALPGTPMDQSIMVTFSLFGSIFHHSLFKWGFLIPGSCGPISELSAYYFGNPSYIFT